jgi:hypothetical protein
VARARVVVRPPGLSDYPQKRERKEKIVIVTSNG